MKKSELKNLIREIHESLIAEKFDLNPEHDYGVFRLGGPYDKNGLIKYFSSKPGELYYTFKTADEANSQAKRSRRGLEDTQEYVSYQVAKLTPYDKKIIAKMHK